MMKNVLLAIEYTKKWYLFILVIFCIQTFTFSAMAQPVLFKTITELQSDGYTIDTTISIKIAKNERIELYINLSARREYVFIGMSKNTEVVDIDLYLYDNIGNLKDKDQHYYAQAKIKYKVSNSEEIILAIKNHNSVVPYKPYICELIIAYRPVF